MTVRAKIIAFQIFFVGVVLGLAAIVYIAVNRAEYFIERVRSTHVQLEMITSLSLHANRYSEQIAEMLLFGEQGRAEFEEARQQLEASFDALARASRDEAEMLNSAAERDREQDELVIQSQMRVIGEVMHARALELLELKLAGRPDEAYRRYHDEIEERLDDDLQRLIDIAIADEQDEVRRMDRRTASMAREMTAIVALVVLAGAAASVLAILLVNRALSRPIARLVAGVEAIGRGELGHRIAARGHDELAVLSKHFNAMAAELERQRRALLDHQSTLEWNVRERTMQLEAANSRLRDLDRLRVLFLAEISHELRTPLTILRGEAEVVLRGRDPAADELKDTLQRVVEQVEGMSDLVDDLLFLTRAEADAVRFDLETLPLQEVLGEVLGEGSVLAMSHGVQLSDELPLGSVLVVGDRQRLKQTLLIALDNAVKYSYPKTTVEVRLATDDMQAVITVRNQGEGIPASDLPYIFDRFYRGRSRAARVKSGSGLGLSIAKWIVEKHDGSIALMSLPEGVTELTIRLPLAPHLHLKPELRVYSSDNV